MTTFALAILVRNQASGLLQTLRALDKNEFDEILILDDASSQDITYLVQDACQQLNLTNVKLFRSEENIGTFENLKRSFWLANSDYVTTMAAEDTLVTGFVDRLRTHIESKNRKIVYVPLIQGVTRGSNLEVGRPQFTENPILDFLLLRNRNLSHGGGATYPRLKVLQSNVMQVSTFNLVEDWLVFYLLAESGFRLRAVEEVLYIHEVDSSKSAKAVRSERHVLYESEIRRLILNRRLGLRLRLIVFLHGFLRRARRLFSFLQGRRGAIKIERDYKC